MYEQKAYQELLDMGEQYLQEKGLLSASNYS